MTKGPTRRPRRRPRFALALSGAAVLLGLAVTHTTAVSGAEVDNSTPTLQVRAIDNRDGQLKVDYMYRGTTDASSPQLTVNGKAANADTVSLAEAGLPASGVVVLDTSSAVSNATVQLAKADLTTLGPGNGPFAQLGLVTTGDGARIVAQPTTVPSALTANFASIVPKGVSSLWDAVVMASDLVAESGETQRNIILVVGSTDAGSAASYSETLTALRNAGASLHVIAIKGSGADGAALRELVGSLGGSFQVGQDREFDTLYGNVVELGANQYRATIDNVATFDGELASLALKVGNEEVAASYRPAVLSIGAEAVKPAPAVSGEIDEVFISTWVKYLIVAFVALAAGGAAFALISLMTKRRDGLNHALRHYDETYGVNGFDDDEQQSAKSALLQNVVEGVGGLAQDRGFLVRVEALLERADLPLRAAEALTFYLGGAIVSVIVTFVMTGSWMFAIGVVLLALILPGFVVDFLAKRRKKKFSNLLPDMLQLLAGTLRAGYSIGQGFEAVSGEIDEPMGKELRRAVTEARLGKPLDEALESVAIRMDSEDFGWAVMAIRIQREVGGNLAELLMTVSDTMVQRMRLRRDVASLTAEGRMSAIILGLLPPGLGFAMYFMNPEYISKLFSGTGLILLVASVFMMLIGFVWMKKTITIEV